MLAGIYVGFGILLIFTIGSPFAAEGAAATKALMGASFAVALFIPHTQAGSWVGFAGNLVPVTIGNIIGGAVFVGAAYWYVGNGRAKANGMHSS